MVLDCVQSVRGTGGVFRNSENIIHGVERAPSYRGAPLHFMGSRQNCIKCRFSSAGAFMLLKDEMAWLRILSELEFRD